jgi:hypothetical protein
MIAARAGLKAVDWDGYMKYWKPSEKCMQSRQRIVADRLCAALGIRDAPGDAFAVGAPYEAGAPGGAASRATSSAAASRVASAEASRAGTRHASMSETASGGAGGAAAGAAPSPTPAGEVDAAVLAAVDAVAGPA